MIEVLRGGTTGDDAYTYASELGAVVDPVC